MTLLGVHELHDPNQGHSTNLVAVDPLSLLAYFTVSYTQAFIYKICVCEGAHNMNFRAFGGQLHFCVFSCALMSMTEILYDNIRTRSCLSVSSLSHIMKN